MVWVSLAKNQFFHSQTIAHEIGHNLGMDHDFNSQGVPRKVNGKKCYGYMDYEDGTGLGDHTNQWSKCSVKDFTDYINQQQDSLCLQGGDSIENNLA